ncbi:nucleotidyltransferase domain-containing protein [Spirosoma montaniterrae]|uniref:Polymerase beta nucleotidyltransferase domain-containing protein n=1 Tax=Spirosoma montaniterrae TaxID=1178516 RepID=A0A1P9WRB3_9BACT|nr:nucleotidyltransferase domain-containing protein [Spirosoma montaniterrae]AQG77910.1 hypothetical protein AWR27_00195 [Spirosoma montaniterrae]
MNAGLPNEILEQITTVFQRNEAVEQAILYGSRAMGTHRLGSDIDLAVSGSGLTFSKLLSLMSQLEDLDLLYSFDVQQLEKITNADLIDHIKRVGICIYTASERANQA